MAREFAEQGVQFIFIYTNEAHPGNNKPHHTSMEQKLQYARDMAAMWDIQRPMLVDDLDGPVHRAYGQLPNMTWIINSAGRVVYKADWTDHRTIRPVVEQLITERDLRRQRERITPYYVEWQPNRTNNRTAFMDGLLDVPGERAVEEFIAASANAVGEEAAKAARAGTEEARSERAARSTPAAGDD